MFTIRSATINDAAAIAHVHVESWRTTYAGVLPAAFLADLKEADRVPVWQEQIAKRTDIVLAELDGEVIGFAAGGAIREPLEDFDAELFAIYLLHGAQRRGIGSALLASLAHDLRSASFRSMAVWVLAGNHSIRFYEHFGAHQVSSKSIGVADTPLLALAYGWPDLKLIPPSTQPVL